MGCVKSRETVPFVVTGPGGKRVAVADCDPARAAKSSTTKQRNNSRFKGVSVGLEVHCLDVFQSKYTGDSLRKWRESKVRVYDGYEKTSKVCIRFDGWSEAHDRWLDLDLEQDLARLAPLRLLSPEQIENGEEMDQYQRQVAYDFLQTGLSPSVDVVTTIMSQRRSLSPTPASSLVATVAGYNVGQKVDIKDVLFKGAETHSSKWRAAEVIECAGSKMRVHFIGWDETWDEVIDLSRDGDRVSVYGSMTSLQSRPSLLQKSHSEIGRRGQRRSFDGKVEYSAGKTESRSMEEKYLEWERDAHNSSPVAEGGGELWEHDDSAPVDLLQNRRAKPGSNQKQRFVQRDFAARPKPPIDRRHSSSGVDSHSRRVSNEISFCDRMESIGLHIVEIEADGNCLFRAVAHQFYLDPERHLELRSVCVQHMTKNRERFEVFCTTNFDHHLRRMAIDGTWATELEVRALEELFDRVFSIYSSDTKDVKPMPMNTNFDERQLLGIAVETVKLSYHSNHYNSIFDVKHALPLVVRKTRILEQSRKDLLEGKKTRC